VSILIICIFQKNCYYGQQVLITRKGGRKVMSKIIIILLCSLMIDFYPEIALAGNEESIFSSNHVLAYYGSPNSWKMGILGDHPPEKLAELLKTRADQYDRLNNEKGVITAFHVVYATVQPKGNLLFVNEEIVKKYIQVAKENKMLVILDHQIGRHPMEKAVSNLLPFAKYDNVHFAIDPEWRTSNPGQEIGSVSGYEINSAQERIVQYLENQRIPGKKILVVHQFSYRMISSRQEIRANYPRIDLVHNMDGIGVPSLKKDTYAFIAAAKNIPQKGFKLFFPERGSKFCDKPLMTPADVLSLKPQPVMISYQ